MNKNPSLTKISKQFFNFRNKFIILFFLFGTYLIFGKLGLNFTFLDKNVTAVWPVAGIALAAILLQGYWVWPAIFLGAFAVNLSTSSGFITLLGIATGNTLEAVIGAYLIKRYAQGCNAFSKAKNVFKFALLAGGFGTMISATIGVVSLVLGQHQNWSNLGSIWLTWWVGNSAGVLIITPLIVLWNRPPFLKWNFIKVGEFLFLLFISFIIGFFIFSQKFHGEKTYHLTYLCPSLGVWAAYRFSQRETLITSLILSGLAIWGTIYGYGPFASETANNSLLTLQGFIAFNTVMALALAAVVSELKKYTEELKQSNQELSRINQVKSEFSAMVSHELRTPLTSIKSGIQAMLNGIDGPITKDQNETLDRAKNNVDRLARFINNVLDYEAFEAGKMKMIFENIDIVSLTADIYKMMKSEVSKKQIHLKLLVPHESIFVICDSDKIKQVIINLVHNAIKFTNQGGSINLSLALKRGIILIEVEDNGVGIKEEDQKKIFELFTQVPNQGILKTGGSGVGLTVCKFIIEQHKGTISVESKPKFGSRFTISIPQKNMEDCLSV